MKFNIIAGCAALAAGWGASAHGQISGFGGRDGTVAPEAAPVFGLHVFDERAPDPYVIAVRSGGAYAARRSGFPSGCYGVVTEAPTVALQVAGAETGLTIFTAGDADTTLAVMDPRGAWRCDDDGARRGSNAALSYAVAESGTWKIWVGDFSDRESDAVLVISEAAPHARPFGAPNARASATPAQVLTLAPGFMPDPVSLEVQTGYGVQLGSMDVYGEPQSGRCSGWTGEAPTAEITWTGQGGDLVFMADGEADVVMDVIAPSGEAVCSDDMGAVDERAQVVFSDAEPGAYQVFVGTYGRFDRATNARLNVSQTPFPVSEDPW